MKSGRIMQNVLEKINLNKTSVGKIERKRQLGRSRRRWEHNIKIDIK
jgi:hypothetical protein